MLKILSSKKYGLGQELTRKIINALSVSKIEIYGKICDTDIKSIDSILNKMRRIMLNSFITPRVDTFIIQSGIPSFQDIRLKCILMYAVGKSRDSVLESIRSERSYLEQTKLKFVEVGIELDNIVKNATFVSSQTSIKNRIFLNIFKKNKSELVPGYLMPEILQFCSDNNIEDVFYTDGSKLNNKVGYEVIHNNNIIKRARLSGCCSVYTAESLAILSSIQYINETSPIRRSAIFTDSLIVLEQLNVNNKKLNETTNNIKNILNKNTIIVWIPSHYGIPGNELADSEAKISTNIDEITEYQISSHDAKNLVKSFMSRKIQ